MAFQRTTTEILVDLTAARASRQAFITGERVEDVWRDGRRMRFATASLAEIDSVITRLEREYESAAAVEAGHSRRRPISLGWRG